MLIRRHYLLVVLGMSASVWLDARSCNVWSREKTAHVERRLLWRCFASVKIPSSQNRIDSRRRSVPTPQARKYGVIEETLRLPTSWTDRVFPDGFVARQYYIHRYYRYTETRRRWKKEEKRNRAYRKACVDLEIGRRRQWRRWRRWPSIAVRGGGGLLALVRVQGLCPYLPLDRCFKLDPNIPTDTSIRRTVAAVWRFSAKLSFVFALCVYFVVYNPISEPIVFDYNKFFVFRFLRISKPKFFLNRYRSSKNRYFVE